MALHLVRAISAFAIILGSSASAQDAPKPQKPVTIAFSQCNSAEPWRAQMDADIKSEAAKHSNIRLIAKDAQNDRARQMAHVREFITARVDALIISPLDTSLTPAVAEAFDAGIPVIVLDRKVLGDKYTVFIGADNRVIGAEVGKWVVKTLGGKGAVVELRGLSSSVPAIDRSEPFREALKGTQIKVVYDADMEWLKARAREKMQAALARSPAKGSIQLVYGANDPAAIAAYEVARDAGREKEMKFVGVDALPHEGIEAVRNGILDATFEYPNGAKEGIAVALDILAGKKPPRNITLGTRLYTRDNLDKGGERIEAEPAP
ncbi:MAG: substrate-binding domain-containing protein [Phycisphaerae bacterium]|nr:substrate-binding domain-containing protein [Phycisphaerae bacterium]MCZ2400359.1 substrate-binding domain-containing protein [Phycisphaerae bacterium]NUQ50020.1 substrate-binding domain-containing protein [Phycisphaerae bacterium]